MGYLEYDEGEEEVDDREVVEGGVVEEELDCVVEVGDEHVEGDEVWVHEADGGERVFDDSEEEDELGWDRGWVTL